MDISDHFYKIRLKCEIFFPTFTREKGPISCQSWEKSIFSYFSREQTISSQFSGENWLFLAGMMIEHESFTRAPEGYTKCSKSSSESEKVHCSLVTHSTFFNKCRDKTRIFAGKVNGISGISSHHIAGD